jgi:diguanylate cyclase (GGDEF)-like protein/PAS domain S-box-containing protein
MVHGASEGVVILGEDSTVCYANPAIKRATGYGPDDFVGTRLHEHLHPEDLQPLLDDLGKSIELAIASRPLEFRIRHADGSWRHTRATSINPLDAGIENRAYSLRDITNDKAIEEELRRRAFSDPLTGLANRSLFMDRLEHALVRGVRQQHPVSVLFLDIDSFKAINDSLGHDAGDEVLTAVARRLRACSRPEDTVARLGGDEFTMLLENATGASNAISVANRIVEKLRRPIALAGDSLFVTASMGIASSGHDLKSADDLLRAADTAMYRAKQRRSVSYEIFGNNMWPWIAVSF